ncbi:MAG: hypothetical protein ACK58L_10320 [Planctomycetota bacterium]
MDQYEVSAGKARQDTARGWGCLTTVVLMLAAHTVSENVGRRIGILRKTQDLMSLVLWHFWSVAWIAAVPLGLFVLSRLFRRWTFFQSAFPGHGSSEFLGSALLAAVIYAVIGAVWLSLFGDQGLIWALVLSFGVLVLVAKLCGRHQRPDSAS